jgi:hypothetical protein
VCAAHARAASVRRPIRPDIGADQSALSSYHAGLERLQHYIIGQRVSIELGAVVAPDGTAVDQQVAATMRADTAHGDKVYRLTTARGRCTFTDCERL